METRRRPQRSSFRLSKRPAEHTRKAMAEGPAAVRSLVAVGAGFFAIAMLSLGGDSMFRALAPQAFDAKGYVHGGQNLLIVLAYLSVFEVVGGYIAGRIAIRKPVLHAVIVGLLVLFISGAVSILTWDVATMWYEISALLAIVPMCFLGGLLCRLRAVNGN